MIRMSSLLNELLISSCSSCSSWDHALLPYNLRWERIWISRFDISASAIGFDLNTGYFDLDWSNRHFVRTCAVSSQWSLSVFEVLFAWLYVSVLTRPSAPAHTTFIHSFGHFYSSLQVLYYSKALPTTARILYRSFTPKRTGNCR